MRRVGSVVAAVAGLALLTGCAEIQQAADTVNAADRALTTAQVCVQAIGAIDFIPSTDPATAVEQSRGAAQELSALAAQAGDVTVSEAIDGVATMLGNVSLDDFATPVEWLQERTSQAAAVLNACAGY
ncbi:bacteriophage spanin2 family protein [Actinokineospora fastidiosa]|uniref:bacteriophage spanin2 family protein n=1 Tax=Actinokineospora fastidiosa TaxID=1816 RepID=UPI0016712BE7|nr:bacteriophage spanin2 family protein [Actinokineospora fastidiosa]